MNIIDETVKLYFDYGIAVQEALEWAKEMLKGERTDKREVYHTRNLTKLKRLYRS